MDGSNEKKRKRSRSRSPSPSGRAKKAAKTGSDKASSKAAAPCPKFQAAAEKYAKAVNDSEGVVRWDEIGKFDRDERSKIRNLAREQGLIPAVPMVAVKDKKDKDIECPIFPAERVAKTLVLDEEHFDKTDADQFAVLNELVDVPGFDKDEQTIKDADGKVKKYTWHHHHDEGKMQLVESGIHSATKHKGGREIWCTGKRR